MPDVPLLRTERLVRAYGNLFAVNGVDFSVREGELRSIIGPNGAGKTTFFRLISGEVPPTSGRIWFREREVTGMRQHAIARLGVAKSYQITSIFPHLSVLENVRVAAQGPAQAFDFWRRAERLMYARERAEAMLSTVGLAGKASALAANLSHGAQRHLEIGIALATAPKLLCLDEPTAGMSIAETQATVELVRRIKQELTMLIVEHDMEVVMGLAHVALPLHGVQFHPESVLSEHGRLLVSNFLAEAPA